tara:strand:- start:890 stop:1072 length:183 start_codon:yes stop_codon:yes gene_type:complete
MTIEEQIDRIIKDLTDAKNDAALCDKGKAGAPGTRLRKIASQAGKDLKAVRDAVIAARKA